jgi:hypothetical protein
MTAQGLIVGLCGYAGSGKDTAAEGCVSLGAFSRRAFADKLKELVEAQNPYYPEMHMHHNDLIARYGLEAAKRRYPRVREELVACGEAHRRIFGEDFWIDACLPSGERYNRAIRVVVSDVRYPNEIKHINKHGGVVFYIKRDGREAANETERETIAACIPLCEYTFLNNGTREELQAAVMEKVHAILATVDFEDCYEHLSDNILP